MEEKVEIIENLEPTKEELERQKILLEIAEFKKVWWKKPAYIAALFPTLLALTTLIYGFANGYFQASFVKLENQKHDLQVEKEKLEADVKKVTEERERLIQEYNNQINERQDKLKVIENLLKQAQTANEEANRLKNQTLNKKKP